MLIRPADELRPPSVPCGPRCTSMRSISPSSLRPMPERERYTPSMNRSEEHTSELQSLMRISYAVFCLKKKNKRHNKNNVHSHHYHTKQTQDNTNSYHHSTPN